MSRRALAATAAALALALAGAGCGDSPEDTAHDHGEDVGEAFRALTESRSVTELDAATQDLKDAVAAVGDDDGSRVQSQLRAQQDKINQLIGGFKSVLSAPDADARDAARSELQGDVQDLQAQAQTFRHSADSVANAFWDGVQDGFEDD